MFALARFFSKTIVAISIFAALTSTSMITLATEKLGLGRPASVEEINGWDIDIRPDGKGLPVGSGDAVSGEAIFIEKCAACHGEFAEGAGRYPVLAGGTDSLNSDRPVKTVGSYWPYATTAFDYIRRAMPFGHAQSLSADEVYAITAYVLYSSDVIEDDFVLDQNTLPTVVMPNQDGFIKDPRPDVPTGEPCMKHCLADVPIIIGKARQIDVTPEEEQDASGESGAQANDETAKGDPVRGKTVFAQCVACHSIDRGEHKIGPSLHAVMGRRAGKSEGFSNYSAAMQAAELEWSQENLRDFLNAPQRFLPGTSMPFAGLKDASKMEDLLAFLRESTASE